MTINPDDPHHAKKEQAMSALYKVIDPELFVNIVDLGLVYDLDFSQEGKITVVMTLSTPHCPLGEAIRNAVHNAMHAVFPTSELMVNIVWEPQWSLEDITPEGRKLLGLRS